MLGRIAVGILIFVALTAISVSAGKSAKNGGRLSVFMFLTMLAYISITVVYFLTKAGYV